jgi:cell division protein ZapE
MGFYQIYQHAIASGQIWQDDDQDRVAHALDKVEQGLARKRFWVFKLRPISGLYLYGSVGVGKTMLVDMFFQSYTSEKKQRVHFHEFMQKIDTELRHLKGKKNPIRIIIKKIAKQTRLLCLDEFMVTDIAHAMILKNVLDSLFIEGVAVIMTSNIAPDALYQNGLNRAYFLPAIALIKHFCTVIDIHKTQDFRLSHLNMHETVFLSSDKLSNEKMNQWFDTLDKVIEDNSEINIQNRNIPYIKRGNESIWFDFMVIGNIPRSQLDYLSLAKTYKNFFISHIPKLQEADTAKVILLIQLIDILYDKKCRLIISCDVSLDKLYTKGEMLSAFKRTLSRLHEMQTEYYLKHCV